MYGVTKPAEPLEFEFYAFHDQGAGSWLASKYSIAGEWVEDRAEASIGIQAVTGGPGGHARHACIVSDPAATVADGTLVGLSADDAITSWDVAAEAVYTYTASDGKHVTWPIWLAGWLYWWEWLPTNPGPTDTLTFTVRKARANLTAEADVGTVTHPSTFPAGTTGYPVFIALSSTLFRSHLKGAMTVNIGTGADTYVTVSSGLLNTPPAHGRPDSAGNAVGPANAGASRAPMAVAVNNNLDVSGLARWPDSWDMEPPVYSFGTSADRTVALHYSDADFPLVSPHAIVAPSTATSGSPTLSVGILNHPETEAPPDLLFLKT